MTTTYARSNDSHQRAALVRRNRTKRGGWTRDFIESIGAAWPPQRGWKEWYIKHGNMEGFVVKSNKDDDNNC